jgi:hypothetical protein
MELQALLLRLVQSLRESDFAVFIHTLEEIAPWVFALDHANYARWLSVFIEDLKRLSVRHPCIYQEFMRENFTVTNINRAFSSIGVEIARLVKEFKGRNETYKEETKENLPHHDDSDSFEKRFRKDAF